jgi:hypothetical protein
MMTARSYYSGRGPISREVVFRLAEQPDDADTMCVGVWTGEKRRALEGEWYMVQGKCRRADHDLDKDVPIARIHPVVRSDLVEIAAFPIDRVADRHLERIRRIRG